MQAQTNAPTSKSSSAAWARRSSCSSWSSYLSCGLLAFQARSCSSPLPVPVLSSPSLCLAPDFVDFNGHRNHVSKGNSLLVYALVFFIIGVPVALPCFTTTTMAVGAAYLAHRKCIVQKLTAMKPLTGVGMLCSDKTGMLTASKDSFMTVAVLASSHIVKSLDSTDKVTIIGLQHDAEERKKVFPGAQENLPQPWKTRKFTPFDPVSKRIDAEVEKDGKKYTVCKGAPTAVPILRKFDPKTVNEYRQTSQAFAEKGLRSLRVAINEAGKDWELLGIMSMFDPPRADTVSTYTVYEAQDLGIHIKLLTGHAVAIAKGKRPAKKTAGARYQRIRVYDSQRLIGSGMSGSDVRDFVEASDGFADLFPEHKYQGVNDPPSLKADCRIALEGASDAAHSAADVVSLEEGPNSIINSITVARQIFHRMKAYIIQRIALCIHLEVYLAFILNETIQVDLIVFLPIFSDVATIAIAYDHAPYAKSPVEWELSKVWVISTIVVLYHHNISVGNRATGGAFPEGVIRFALLPTHEGFVGLDPYPQKGPGNSESKGHIFGRRGLCTRRIALLLGHIRAAHC
ncbi:hypothetical protein C8R45DRAFT_1218647 [Mycena sanguinolenta]|nr:hypothetical protein C8R45DRAFT_1218647 [Mycena sanguinolenta]